MPELPDLTVFSNNIDKRLNGQKMTYIIAHQTKRLNVTAQTLNNELRNATLSAVNRAGKTIHLVFSNQQVLEVHLMIKGGFKIVSDDVKVKYKILSLFFDNKKNLIVYDSQDLVRLTLNPKPVDVPDALDLTLDYLMTQLPERKSKKIKAFLTDQTIIRGIGNAYADEILWESRIAPESLCGKIPESAVNALFNAIPSVLTDAIEQIQMAKPHLLNGEYRHFLKIHNHNNRVSPTGKIIYCQTIGSKITYYSDDQVCYR
ncbi:DNA-formamidopyrimidine glycosylase family protein [Candidatus Parabeggiatoa sp. HSG14]|uniref:DNA-formamidopyrimidine glycosylase family protein n=1 Tax=Candidatus Parabeggiatoa sp. HSG14 TaxID=3055593 RepID=UPI0025A81F4E|nr:DNA-formamidopyrimidine glycosylase family protein [Thiotrichales bacterium HSG14]